MLNYSESVLTMAGGSIQEMDARTANQFQFGAFTLDLQARALHAGGEIVALRPRSFDVLALLVCNAGRLVEKDDLIEAAWPNIIASDESLARCISDIRKALDDTDMTVIRTIPGRGYQFAANVAIAPASGVIDTPQTTATPRPMVSLIAFAALVVFAIVLAGAYWFFRAPTQNPAVTARPSIAVMPLRNNSADDRNDTLAAGLTSDLISALARVPELLVISESTTRRYRSAALDVREIARELAVDTILTGTVQASGNRIRISVQLSDAENGAAIWSDRYDRDATNFLDLQDDIVLKVLTSLQVELTHGETARILGGGTDDINAWLLNIEGLAEGFQFKRENNFRARSLFTEASEIDPAWAAPVSGLAWTYREAVRRGWSDNAGADREKWLRLAEKCQELDTEYAGCYIQLGNYHIENGRVEDGLELREKALQLAPNDLSALSGLAWQLILVGDVDRGLELLRRAKLVSPIHPAWLIATEAYGFQMAGQYDKAIAGFRYALENGNFPDWHARLAAAMVEAGDVAGAREQARLFREIKPEATVADLTRILRIQDAGKTARYADLLRKAGIPD